MGHAMDHACDPPPPPPPLVVAHARVGGVDDLVASACRSCLFANVTGLPGLCRSRALSLQTLPRASDNSRSQKSGRAQET